MAEALLLSFIHPCYHSFSRLRSLSLHLSYVHYMCSFMPSIRSNFLFMSLFHLLALHLPVSIILMTQVYVLCVLLFVACFLIILLGVVFCDI